MSAPRSARRRDRGSFYVLEAIIVCTLMLMTAAWYVANYTGDTTGSGTNDHEVIYDELTQENADELQALQNLPPLVRGAGNDGLGSLFTLNIWNQTAEINAYFHPVYQPGVGWEVVYRNIFAHGAKHWTTLAGEGGQALSDEATGEVSVDNWWSWSATYPTLTVQDTVAPLDTVTVHIHHSEMAKQPGDWLQTRFYEQDAIRGKPIGAPHTYDGETILSVPTEGPAVDVYTTTRTDGSTPVAVFARPLNMTPATPSTIDIHVCVGSTGAALNSSRSWQLPRLDIDVPTGWSWSYVPPNTPFKLISGPDVFTLKSFSSITAANGHLAARLEMKPRSVIPAGQCSVLEFSVKYATGQGPILASPLEIHLSNGTLADAHPLITDLGAPQATLPRLVTVQAPYLMRPGSLANVTAIFMNGGSDALLSRVVFHLPGGYDRATNHGAGAPLFHNVADLKGWQPASGTWNVLDDRTVAWQSGDTPLAITADGAQEFSFQFTVPPGITTSSEPSSDFAWRSNVSFPANAHYENASLDPTSPGLARSSTPAAALANGRHGYPIPGLGGAATTYALAEAPSAGIEHPQPSWNSYATGPNGFTDLASLRNALYNSTFNASRHAVTIDSSVNVTLDARSLATTLTQKGVTTLWANFSAYPPPSMGRSPIALASFTEKTSPASPVTAIALLDPAGGANPNAYLLVPSSSTAYALAHATGQTLWKKTFSDTPKFIAATPAKLPTAAAVFVVHGGTTVGGTFTVDAFDPTTGNELAKWPQTGTGLPVVVAADTTTSPPLLYVVTQNTATGDFATSYPADGSTPWIYAFNFHGTPVAGHTYVASTGSVNGGSKRGLAVGDTTNGNITLLDATGKVTSTSGFPLPGLLAVAPAGDTSDSKVLALTTTFAVLLPKNPSSLASADWNTPVQAATGTFARFTSASTNPPDLEVVDATGNLVILEGATGHQVLSLSFTGPIPPNRPDGCPHPLNLHLLDHYFCDGSPQLPLPDGLIAASENAGGNWILAGYRDPSTGAWSLAAIDSKNQALVPVTDARLALADTLAITSNGGTATLAFGTASGTANTFTANDLLRPTTTTFLWSVQPVPFAGLYPLHYAVPSNGFLGTTILRATLTWQQPVTGGSVTETANLLDWIEVIGPDGQDATTASLVTSYGAWQRDWESVTG